MTSFARSFSKETRGAPVAANRCPGGDLSGTANDRIAFGEGRHVPDTANSMAEMPASRVLPARRMDLKPADRDTFDRWARWVAAFYSVLAVSLLGAMLLGAHTPADRNELLASHATARSLLASPAPVTRSIVK